MSEPAGRLSVLDVRPVVPDSSDPSDPSDSLVYANYFVDGRDLLEDLDADW